MFGKKEKDTLPPQQPAYVIQSPSMENLLEDKPIEQTPSTVEQVLQPTPVQTTTPVVEETKIEDESYILACETISEGIFNYIVRSNIPMKPGKINIEEAQ